MRVEARAEPAILAVFDAPEAIERAVEALRALGYTRMEAYTPHPMPRLEALLGIPRSRAPRAVLAGGVAGAAFGFFLQYWLNGVNQPLDVGGRPLFSAPAFIPIAFETTILFAALTAFATWLVVTRLPSINGPILAVEGFTSVSIDRFWLAIDTRDPSYVAEGCAQRLRELGAVQVSLMPEVER